MIKFIVLLFAVGSSLVLYCCLIQAKKEDEKLDKMYRGSQKKNEKRDEE